MPTAVTFSLAKQNLTIQISISHHNLRVLYALTYVLLWPGICPDKFVSCNSAIKEEHTPNMYLGIYIEANKYSSVLFKIDISNACLSGHGLLTRPGLRLRSGLETLRGCLIFLSSL